MDELPSPTNALVPSDERRTVPRVARRAVVIMPFGPGMHDGFERGTMLNCSSRGVGLLLHRPLQLNTRLFLKVRISNVALAVYTVRHCHATPDGYEVGARFHEVIGNESDARATGDDVYAVLLAD